MAWINLPISSGDAVDPSVFTLDWGNQFINAVIERRDILNLSPVWVLRTGRPAITNVASVNSPARNVASGNGNGINWAALQTDVQAMVAGFVVVQDYDGFVGPGIPTYTLATWRDAAGIHADGFTRKYPKMITGTGNAGTAGQRAWMGTVDSEAAGNANSLASYPIMEHDGSGWIVSPDQESPVSIIETHGIMQRGDYFGAWIPNELYNGLRLLVWTTHGGTLIEGQSRSTPDTGWDNDSDTWIGAYASEAAEWATQGISSSFFGCFQQLDGSYAAGSPEPYIADSAAGRAKVRVTVPPTAFACEVDLLSFGIKLPRGPTTTNVFQVDLLGVPAIEGGFRIYDTLSVPAGGGTVGTEDWIGTVDMPTIGPAPAENNPSTAGGAVTVAAIARWDVEGGLSQGS